MTRSQVRAACRRMRDHDEEIEEEAGELNLVPYMDIVTNIIIFLLASVVNQVALGNINVSSPDHLVGRRRRPPDTAAREAAAQPDHLGRRHRLHVAGSGGVLPAHPESCRTASTTTRR